MTEEVAEVYADKTALKDKQAPKIIAQVSGSLGCATASVVSTAIAMPAMPR